MMTDLQLWNLTASVDRGLHTFGLSWVIGRGGRIISALRTLAKAAHTKSGERTHVEINA